MKRIFYIFILTIAISPCITLASWWNPFTWNIFQKKEIIKETVIKEKGENKTNILSTTTKPVKFEEKKINVKPKETTKESSTPAKSNDKTVQNIIVPEPVKVSDALSDKDKMDIITLDNKFINAIRNKDKIVINSIVSDQSRLYFNEIVNIAKAASKEQLLSYKFSTIISVITTRILATSSTLGVKWDDVIDNILNYDSITELRPQSNNEQPSYSFKVLKKDAVETIVSLNNKPLYRFVALKEQDIWKLDFSSVLFIFDESIESKIQQKVTENQKSREEFIQKMIEILFGKGTAIDYLIWTPLNEREDLNVDNASFGSYSDTANGYSIIYSRKWDTDYVDKTTFFLAPYSMDGIRPGIAITVNNNPNLNGKDLDEYAKYFMEELPKVKTDLSGAINSEKIIFQNQPAYRMKYKRLRTFDEGRTYITQISESTIVFGNNRAYLIEYRNGLASFEKDKPLADKIINSFRIEIPCVTNVCSSYSRQF